jgi:hypothetical protein
MLLHHQSRWILVFSHTKAPHTQNFDKNNLSENCHTNVVSHRGVSTRKIHCEKIKKSKKIPKNPKNLKKKKNPQKNTKSMKI